MPTFVLGRNHTISSIYGHNIVFVKGQPTFVPPLCVNEVVAIGGVCTDGPVDVLDPEFVEPTPLTPQEREDMLLEAFKDLIAKGEREDFTGQGLPSVKAVEKATGLIVTTKEIQAVWRKQQELKAAE